MNKYDRSQTLTQSNHSALVQIKIHAAHLVLLDEQQQEIQRWILERHQLSIGSLKTAQIQLNHPTISRQHARIEVDERGYRLIDQASKNGVFVNRVRVVEAFLSDGDIIHLGEITLRFSEIKESANDLQLWNSNFFDQLYGQTTIMRELFVFLHRISQSQVNLLIEGESGTGKELAARGIHRYSDRSKKLLLYSTARLYQASSLKVNSLVT